MELVNIFTIRNIVDGSFELFFLYPRHELLSRPKPPNLYAAALYNPDSK